MKFNGNHIFTVGHRKIVPRSPLSGRNCLLLPEKKRNRIAAKGEYFERIGYLRTQSETMLVYKIKISQLIRIATFILF